MSALQWWAVVQRFANPDRPVLDGWPSVAATAGFYVAVMTVPPLASPLTLGIVVVPVVFAISPLLIGERAGPSRYLWVTPPAIAVATVAVLLPRFGVAAATAIAVSAIAAWIAAFRIIAVLPARPLAQATVRLALLLCLVITAALMDTAVYQDLPGGWILGATGIALCVIAELAARAAARFSRARIRPVIPRA
jgi:hypothetical protein